MQTIFALVDCNSFYCSCERLFRPDLIAKPVGVLSNNDGCFVSRTNELKELGVPMGAPYFKYKNICDRHKVAIFSANFSLYTNISDRVMNCLSQFAPELEIYSVDEAFLNLKGIPMNALEVYAHEIKKTVQRQTGIPVSIGIGPSKALAKLANDTAKKRENLKGVLSVMDKISQDKVLADSPIEAVWGVGRKNSVKMRMLGIKTAKDLRDYKNPKTIQRVFTKLGVMLKDELSGISCFSLNEKNEKKKEIISSRTFGAPVFDLTPLREAVASYASLACEKLRKQDSVCNTVEVYVRTNPFKDVMQYSLSESYKLQAHTNDTRKIIECAWKALDKIYREGFEYKKALVKLSGIRDRSGRQLSLLEANDKEEDQRLMLLMDKINTIHGPHTLKSMGCGLNNAAWKMKQTLRSPSYVVGWNELALVK